MRLTFAGLPLAGGFLVALLSITPTAVGQTLESDFYKARFLQTDAGELEAALALYERVTHHPYDRVAERAESDSALQRRAQVAIEEIREDLASAEFSRLMPSETIFFAELNRPGAKLGSLLKELGLLSDSSGEVGLGISPRLLDAALGMRGAAVALTAIDPNGGPPEGIVVLHPGDQDALRGVIETAIGNGGRPVEPIRGAQTWSVEGESFVCLTRRLVIASRSRDQIAGVIGRLHGDSTASFADADSMQSDSARRDDDLMFFHLNAEPVLPLLRHALEQEAKRDPEVALAMTFLDIDSLVGVTGRVDVESSGIDLQLTLELEEGHRNLAFNLLRTPPLQAHTLRGIPEGVAFFLATSLNTPSAVAPPSGDPDRPIVTAMDFGREVFANIVDIAVFGMAPGTDSSKGSPMPDVVASIRVNDGRRSRSLWNFVLGLVSQSSGAASNEPVMDEIAGRTVERFSIEGVPVYLFTAEKELLISPSRSALERTFAARAAGKTVLEDPLFEDSLAGLRPDTNFALLASPARCARIARRYSSAQEAREIDHAVAVLQDTVIFLGCGQSDTELSLAARITNLPDVSPLLAHWIQERQGQVARSDAPRVTASESKVRETQGSRGDFEELLAKGRYRAAEQVAMARAKALGDDAKALNNLAWELLTEDRMAGKFDEAARKIALRANELSEYSDWALLDTLALAEFRIGKLDSAVDLQRKAVSLAQGTQSEREVRQTLERYLQSASQVKAEQQASGAQ